VTVSTAATAPVRVRLLLERKTALGRPVLVGACGLARPLYPDARLYVVELDGGAGTLVLSADQLEAAQ
jgi:hypothetical protein